MALNHKMRRTLWVALIFAAGAVFDGWQLARIHSWNRAISDGSVILLSGKLPPQILFAQAYFLERANRHQEALILYQRVANESGGNLRAAAKFNSANLHLREVLSLRGTAAEAQVLPLTELAKEGYRQVLRADSHDWDAKYNLERALRLAPEGEDADNTGLEPPPGMERAPTTMKGFTLGLP